MTYRELLMDLERMRRVSPDGLDDDVRFVDLEGEARPVRAAEYNDGSVRGVGPNAFFLSEV